MGAGTCERRVTDEGAARGGSGTLVGVHLRYLSAGTSEVPGRTCGHLPVDNGDDAVDIEGWCGQRDGPSGYEGRKGTRSAGIFAAGPNL